MTTLISGRWAPFSAALALAFMGVACSSSDSGPGKTDDNVSADEKEPVYLIQTAIYGTDETFNYTVVSHELDWNIDLDRLKSAREFEGYTGIEGIGGTVFAADGSAPFIRKYKIDDDLKWSETGELNFSAYPMDEWNYMNFYFQSVKNDDDVYFYYGAEKTSRVHWSPTSWEIVAAHEDTAIPKPPVGYTLNNGGNRTGMRDYAGPVVQPFFISNEETGDTGGKSWLAVYDEETHEEKDVIEVDCPSMQQVTKDEDGNLYFATTYDWSPQALSGKGTAACVVRVNADGTLDESFAPNDLREWTGGFYGINFRYMKSGLAVANVLHHDRIPGFELGNELDAATIELIDTDTTLWETHVINLEAGTSKVLTGFKPEHDIGGYTIYTEVDGRYFVVVQLDTETTKSAIYELDLDEARVEYVGDAEGDIWGVIRLR